MDWIIGSGLRFGRLIVALAIGLTVIGIAQLRSAPVDVYPEFMPPSVEIQTEALEFFAAHVGSDPLRRHGRADFAEQFEFGISAIAREIFEAARSIEISASTVNFREKAIDLTCDFEGIFEFCVASINETEAERLGGANRGDELDELRIVSEIEANHIHI